MGCFITKPISNIDDDNDDYWSLSNEESIIFKPNFNKELDEYYVIINKYKKLYFSNYNDPLMAIKENKLKFENFIYFRELKRQKLDLFCEGFNKKIDLRKLNNLTHIYFGTYFNQQIEFPKDNNIECISFGQFFNQNVDLSNCHKLKQLYFDLFFNVGNVIENKQNNLNFDNCVNLEYLHFSSGVIGFEINLSKCEKLNTLILNSPAIINSVSFPKNLKNIYIGSVSISYFNPKKKNNVNKKNNTNKIEPDEIANRLIKLLNDLPSSIEEITFSNFFNIPINNLPNTIKKIIFEPKGMFQYEHELNNLPDSVELLQLPSNYILEITKFPPNLKKIICDKYYPYRKNIKKKNIQIENYY